MFDISIFGCDGKTKWPRVYELLDACPIESLKRADQIIFVLANLVSWPHHCRNVSTRFFAENKIRGNQLDLHFKIIKLPLVLLQEVVDNRISIHLSLCGKEQLCSTTPGSEQEMFRNSLKSF